MQNKLLAAAALASSATALKIQAPTTTLAQDTAYTECHGTYAYQCIEEKVEKSLGTMTADVEAQKDQCLVVAKDTRQEIVEEVEDLRAQLERSLGDLRRAQIDDLNDRLDAAVDAIEAAVDKAVQELCDQLEANQNGTSPAAIERKRVQGEIKKVYYGDGNGAYGANDLKNKIAKKVDDFNAWLEENYCNCDFGDAEIAEVEAEIAAQQKAMDDAIAEKNQEWNDALAKATADLNEAIERNTDKMDALIKQKSDDINAVVDKLTEDFIVIFWDTVEEIYKQVNYYERQGLIWKALYQKEAFLAEIAKIR